ncbi:immunoglobulin domain-containing protein [Vibrio algivorus]|uniref:Ig-like domain-containing protein n=1 Tax=Vibrio algivorus TaxID=1667024 RepID=A0A557P380_9VIBR|nr:immunoglobulin domain-containing protein [Vibrio algivorus]TVO35097.1 hypothetical protein FOF44_12400 [Vibrio algivorus]GLT13919.1 hypothetical protein GCM10007931_08930 [Vibrio algivorus]
MALFIDNQEMLNLSIDGIAIDNVNVDGVTVAQKPTITTQPIATTIDDTQTAILSVVADGLGSTLSYQWYMDDTAISGATAASYTFTPSATGTYSFYCRVNGFGGYTQTDSVNISVETSGSIHQWTLGQDLTAIIFNSYGFVSSGDSSGVAIGDFQPRSTIIGLDCVSMVLSEYKDPSNGSAAALAFLGNFSGSISVDVAGYGVMSGPLAYSAEDNSTYLNIWTVPPEGSPSGATNGEGFSAFMKSHIGQTVTVKITTE